MNTAVEKTVRVSAARARRLEDLATARGTTEDALVEKALDILFELSEGGGAEDREAWSSLTAASLERVWDNEADAAYDDWRRLYGVPAR